MYASFQTITARRHTYMKTYIKRDVHTSKYDIKRDVYT